MFWCKSSSYPSSPLFPTLTLCPRRELLEASSVHDLKQLPVNQKKGAARSQTTHPFRLTFPFLATALPAC
jgi:hypothetical protein